MERKTGYGKDVFNMLGGVEGVRALANCFYDIMDDIPEARKIRDMHPKNLGPTRENLTLFLCGWLGGPSLYKDKYGSINLTNHHALLPINVAEKEMWLTCMKRALEQQPIENDLKIFLLERFRMPAEKICAWCQKQLLQIAHCESRPPS
ncbi:globin [Desulfopila sp. IMCC35006]|uniref:group II truncated hemoglobin n=1 Tax=Desulfopila sp. IMCC35006 TaxID=2569542 RepID=UPI0010ABF51F|nr:group II truncated hemoglobin [Desulfopila sp. IMCC35006]TKB28060.1 globin [Desulfopila sp. IMCC35006]